MRIRVIGMLFAIGVLASPLAFGAAPGNAPAGTTGLCKDGTFYSGLTKQGACRGHKGVKDWYAAEAAPTAASKPPAPAPVAAAPSSAPTPAKAAVVVPIAPGTPAASAVPKASTPAQGAAPASAGGPGGGAGKVWINKQTKIYHCPGDRWYGKTKNGEYITVAEANALGAKPDHGKACN